MELKFCLCPHGSAESMILRGAEGEKLRSKFVVYTNVRQLDETEASKDVMKEVNERLIQHFSCNDAIEYMNYLNKFNLTDVTLAFELKKNSTQFTVRVEAHILKILKDIFKEKKVEIWVNISQATVKCGTAEWSNKFRAKIWKHDKVLTPNNEQGQNISTKGMWIGVSDQTGVCVDHKVEIPKAWKPYLKESVNGMDKFAFMGKISIDVSLNSAMWGGFDERMELNLPKRILEDGIQSDVAIISKAGNEIKCHKNFLAAHSPVFEAMFRSDCKETATNKVEVLDMSEELINFFLAYLYYGDLTAANADSQTAFGLFEAAHKYEVTSLEEAAKGILLHQSTAWFDVGIALQLFSVYGDLEVFEDLRMKTLRVMKVKYEELEKLEDYRQLFAKDLEGAMRLCKYAFSA